MKKEYEETNEKPGNCNFILTSLYTSQNDDIYEWVEVEADTAEECELAYFPNN